MDVRNSIGFVMALLYIFNSISCAAEKCNNADERKTIEMMKRTQTFKKIEEEGYQITTCDKQEMRPDISRWHGEDRWGFFLLFLRQSHAGLRYTHRKCKDQSLMRLDGNHHVPLSSILLIIPPQDRWYAQKMSRFFSPFWLRRMISANRSFLFKWWNDPSTPPFDLLLCNQASHAIFLPNYWYWVLVIINEFR